VFARLLNSLLHWFKRRPIDHPEVPPSHRSNGGAPDHWLRMQRHVPPEHWVRVAKDASQAIRTTDEESGLSPSTTWKTNVKDHRAVRSSPNWADTFRDAAPMRNAEFPEAEMASEPKSGTSFETGRAALRAETHWQPKSTEKAEGPITRLFRRLSAKSQAVEPRLTFGNPALVEAKTPKRFPEVPRAHSGNQGSEWRRTQEKTVSAPTVFPGVDGSHADRASFTELPSQARLTHLEPWFSEQHRSAAHSRHQSQFLPSRHSEALVDTGVNFLPKPRLDSERRSASWPELPSSIHQSSTSFAGHGFGQVAEEMNFADTVPANCWPELDSDRGREEQTCRSLMRTVQRAQRRDREQRGY